MVIQNKHSFKQITQAILLFLSIVTVLLEFTVVLLWLNNLEIMWITQERFEPAIVLLSLLAAGSFAAWRYLRRDKRSANSKTQKLDSTRPTPSAPPNVQISSINTTGPNSPGIVLGNLVINQTIVEQYKRTRKKQWRQLGIGLYRIFASIKTDTVLEMFTSTVTDALYAVYKDSGYSKFTALLTITNEPIKNSTIAVYRLVSHKVRFCQRVQEIHEKSLRRAATERQQGNYEKEKNRMSKEWEESPLRQWDISFEVDKVAVQQIVTPLQITFDSDNKCIRIESPKNVSTKIKDYPDHLERTSELLTWAAAIEDSRVFDLGDVGWLLENYRLQKLVTGIAEHSFFDFNKVQVNVDDDEEWDYLNPSLDEDVMKYKVKS